MSSDKKNVPLSQELAVAQAAADASRGILMNYLGNLSQISEKDQAGLVTEADRESEENIVSRLRSHFPDHIILGEESGLSSGKTYDGEEAFKSGSVWMIDPLDGTTNFVHQFPIFCISIALQVDGELVVGVVDAPLLKQRFHAVKGQGAYLNGQRIHTSERKGWDQFLLGTGFCVSKKDQIDKQVDIVRHFLHKTRGIRRAGAAAYDLCLVAQGVFDAFWENNLNPWDTAAGTLLVKEAGGEVTNFAGQKYSALMNDILAGSSHAQSMLFDELKTFG